MKKVSISLNIIRIIAIFAVIQCFAETTETFIISADKINSDSISLKWPDSNAYYYRLFKSENGSNFSEVKTCTFQIYYKTSWEQSYIHFGGNDGVWTTAPGYKMSKDDSGKYAGYFKYTISGPTFVSVVFNNGNNEWDNNKSRNYILKGSGIYVIDSISSSITKTSSTVRNYGFMNNRYIDWNIIPDSIYKYQVFSYDANNNFLRKSLILTAISPSKEISIYPYLTWDEENKSMSSVVINFETAKRGEYRLFYGTDKNNINNIKLSDIGYIHHVRLRGLSQDTEYYYRIDSDELKSQVFKFRTAKNKPQQLSFILLNDMQDGVDYNSPPRVWEDVANEIGKFVNDRKVDFLVAPGDLISNVSNMNWKIFFDKGKNLFPYIVMMPAVGNHDTAGDETHERNESNYFGEDSFMQHYRMPGGKSYYTFSYGNAIFISIDSEVLSDYPSIVEHEQYQWIQGILDKNKGEFKWIFVYQHIPPYSVASRNRDKCFRIRPLAKLFDGVVDWNFSGHVHSYQRFKPLRYNTENDDNPLIEKSYGTNNNQGVGYIVLGPSGNDPSKLAVDKKGFLEYPTVKDTQKGAISEVTFTKVDINGDNIKFTTYGLGDLKNKKKLHIIDSFEYNKN